MTPTIDVESTSIPAPALSHSCLIGESGALARFIPSPAAVSRVYKRWARQWNATEMPMNCVNKQYCSATLAVLCDGTVTPCATLRPADASSIHDGKGFATLAERHRRELTFERMRDPANLPAACAASILADSCWGCRSRAYAAGLGIYGPDPRCFRTGVRQSEA